MTHLLLILRLSNDAECVLCRLKVCELVCAEVLSMKGDDRQDERVGDTHRWNATVNISVSVWMTMAAKS